VEKLTEGEDRGAWLSSAVRKVTSFSFSFYSSPATVFPEEDISLPCKVTGISLYVTGNLQDLQKG
jgi:hypothetical protein